MCTCIGAFPKGSLWFELCWLLHPVAWFSSFAWNVCPHTHLPFNSSFALRSHLGSLTRSSTIPPSLCQESLHGVLSVPPAYEYLYLISLPGVASVSVYWTWGEEAYLLLHLRSLVKCQAHGRHSVNINEYNYEKCIQLTPLCTDRVEHTEKYSYLGDCLADLWRSVIICWIEVI